MSAILSNFLSESIPGLEAVMTTLLFVAINAAFILLGAFADRTFVGISMPTLAIIASVLVWVGTLVYLIGMSSVAVMTALPTANYAGMATTIIVGMVLGFLTNEDSA